MKKNLVNMVSQHFVFSSFFFYLGPAEIRSYKLTTICSDALWPNVTRAGQRFYHNNILPLLFWQTRTPQQPLMVDLYRKVRHSFLSESSADNKNDWQSTITVCLSKSYFCWKVKLLRSLWDQRCSFCPQFVYYLSNFHCKATTCLIYALIKY